MNPDASNPGSGKTGPGQTVLDIRKYPNRRYYDATRSRHLTLEDIRALIRDGWDLRVTDTETSADITARVLTQVIIELDAPKVELFPIPLLKELIRVNDQLMKGCLEQGFKQSTSVLIDYMRQIERPLRESASAFSIPGAVPSFAAFWSSLTHPAGGMASASSATDAASSAPAVPAAETDPAPRPGNVDEALRRLEQQFAELQARINPGHHVKASRGKTRRAVKVKRQGKQRKTAARKGAK